MKQHRAGRRQRIWTAAVTMGVAMGLTMGVAIGVAIGGCGGGKSVAPGAADGAGAGSAAAATAATTASTARKRAKLLPRTKRPITAMARAFLNEAETAEDDPVGRKWLDDAHAAVQALASGNPALAQGLGAPPPLVASAYRALDAWAQSGEPMSIAEQGATMSALFPSFRVVTSLATVVEHSDDPRVLAALRFAKALRAPDNAPIAITLGSDLAARWAMVLVQARKQPVTAALRDYAVTEQDAMALGHALVSSSLELARMITYDDWQREAHASGALPDAEAPPPRRDGEPGSALDPSSFSDVVQARQQHGLSTKGDWVSEEFAAYSEFWNETESLVANAVSPAEVIAIFDQRIALSIAHPTSMLVRLVSGMVLTPNASQIVESCADDAQLYAELLAGAPAK